ncbi:putative tetratricopeptide-like helical domain superfamily [Helianthus annuus]|nr:putative tetratricopeptide-like helical domain superfamily [Helianthus annuus]
MGVRVASGCLNWSRSTNYWPSSSSPQTLASAISSPSTRCRRLTNVAVLFQYQPAMFGTKLNRPRSLESRDRKSTKNVVKATLDAQFSDEEFCKEIQELALTFHLSDDDDVNTTDSEIVPESETQNPNFFVNSNMKPPEWTGDMIPASIERKANSVDLPFSLRIIQKKKQWQEGFREAGESAYCSVKKAFSSMVFIIRELQSYTLQMREALFYEDLQGVLVRVQKEMNASFVWLFQQVFSHTPTLMVYVMILLANYSVHAMSNNVAFAAVQTTMESISFVDIQKPTNIDSSSVKTFPVVSNGKHTSIDGINGGGGKSRPVASGTDGEESFNGAVGHHQKVIPDETSAASTINPSVSGQVTREEESGLWQSIVEETVDMQDVIRNGALDHHTMQRFVSPVNAKVMEEDNASESHFRTDLLYQMGLSEEPDNTLLLANYAQFLYIIAQDFDRAEEYFKRATKVEPKDAEALSKYANFLWEVRKDLWAAEETLLEAISVDPINPFYAATYANFLWANGPDDTCLPVDSPEITNS